MLLIANRPRRSSGGRATIALSLLLMAILAGCNDESSTQPSGEVTRAEVQTVSGDRELTLEQRENLELTENVFAKAPEPMRAIARRIAMGETPGQDELKALGADIDRSYPNRPHEGMTLLSAALRYRNLDAIDALLAAGADPYILIDPDSPSSQASKWNFLFLAVTTHGRWIEEEDRHDMTFSNQVLALYLKHGGDPNYRWRESDESLLDRTVSGNIDGFKMLVEAGVDPWASSRHGRPLPIRLVTRSGSGTIPFIRYLAEEGFYDDVSADQMQEMIAGATRRLQVGVRTDPEEMGAFYYARFGEYADAVKLILERTGTSLPRESELYRLLYVDDHLYRN